MARAMWKGAIQFGLVTIPVKLYLATESDYTIRFNMLHAKDLSRWTPGINVGQPYVFGDHCYLVKHAKGWMLWDSGNPDRLAAAAFSLAWLTDRS